MRSLHGFSTLTAFASHYPVRASFFDAKEVSIKLSIKIANGDDFIGLASILMQHYFKSLLFIKL